MKRASMLCVLATLSCGGTKPSPVDPVAEPRVDHAPVDWAASGVDWSKPPAPGAEPAFAVPVPTRFQLANGLTVLVVTNRRLPLVATQLVVAHAGSAADPAGKQGLAALVVDLLDESSSQHTALELASELERLGTYLVPGVQADAAVVHLEGLRETLPQSLRLLSFAVRAPRITDDFERVKADRLSALRRRGDEPRAMAELALDRVLFGSNPYAHPSAGYTSTVQGLTADDATRFHLAQYAPGNTTLVVAGDIDADTLRPMLEETFGKWKAASPKPARAAPVPVARTPRLIVVDKPGAAQTELRIGRVLITRGDPAYVPTMVANTVLGGSFTSRLNRRLREELGYTYGASSSFWLGRTQGTWQARTALVTANTLEGVTEALRLIEVMRTEDVPEAELERAKQLLIRELPGSFARNYGVTSTFAELIAEGQPTDWYQRYRDEVGKVTVAQVRERAAASWSRDQLVVVAVGDLGAILPGLLGLGLGNALELDAEGAVLRTHNAR